MAWPTPTDYQEVVQHPRSCFADPELQGGSPRLDRFGLPRPVTGMFASVYEMNCSGRKFAVRCFLRNVPDREHRYAVISSHLQKAQSQFTVRFEFLKQGIRVRNQWYPILKMEWVNGEPLNAYVERNRNDSAALQSLAHKFFEAVSDLKRNSIAHGDLQHGNILVVNGEIKFIDYDGMFVPGLRGLQSQELGHRNYQHPGRSEKDFGPELDGFAAWVIYASLVALSVDSTLWTRVNGGDECLLFRHEDFVDPVNSRILTALESSSDHVLRSLASTIRGIAYGSNLSAVPPIDQSLAPAPLGGLTKAPVGPATGQPGGAWVVDYLPFKQARLSVKYLWERIGLAAYGGFGLALGYLVWDNVLNAAAAGQAAGIGLFTLTSWLVLRYRHFEVVAEKSELVARLKQVEQTIKNANRVYESIRRVRAETAEVERRTTEDIDSKRRVLAKQERDETDKIDRNLNTILAGITPEIQKINKAEQAELAKALTALQSQFLTRELARFDIASATIPGIGPALKSRLAAAGITSAADISYWGPQVHGIGPVKRDALTSWRQGLEARFQHQVPRVLPAPQESAIRSTFRVQRQSYEIRENSARSEANQKKSSVRTKYGSEQNRLSQELRSLREEWAKTRAQLDQEESENRERHSQAHFQMAKTQRELTGYKDVRFGAYLRGIV